MARILIIDDDASVRDMLRACLEAAGYECAEAPSGEEALSAARRQRFDLSLLDFRMPGINGIETLRQLKQVSPLLPVVFLTAADDSEVAIDAMRYGAFDYLAKPVEAETLEKTVRQALEASLPMRVKVEFDPAPATEAHPDRIIGRSRPMLDLYKLTGKAAASNATVLLTGESGTGKELVARAIYQHGRRSDRLFLAVNCAAMPENLLESALFGHERGAFTGAYERHIGKFEQANGGTLFLDEVGDLTSLTQAKILRVLQEKTFERVGGSETLSTDVRVVAATNKDLRREVEKGVFREDLFYRLNVLHIRLPPLRERKEDIPEICTHFFKQLVVEIEKPYPVLTAEAARVLQSHDWPGNVRELRNVLAKAMVTAPSPVLLPEHLEIPQPSALTGQGESMTGPGIGGFTFEQLDGMPRDLYRHVIEDVERHLLEYALRRTQGNQVHAGKILGISRSCLRERMQRYGLLSGGAAGLP